MSNVVINGQTVDADDPCAMYAALYSAKIKMMTGGGVEEVMIGDLATQRRTRWGKGDLKALDAELARLQDLCNQASGGRKGRFAIRAGFRRLQS